VLATIYSMEEPVPVARLAESVWDSVRAHFDVDSLTALSQSGVRGRADNDLEHIFDAFEALGAVTSVHGVASDMFSDDLDEGFRCPPVSVAVPEGEELLSGLLRDPELGPVTLLVRRADLGPGDVNPAEAAWLMAGSVLELLEVGGPDAVIAQLAELPRPQREDVVRAVRDSGYPARETLQDFQAPVAGPAAGRQETRHPVGPPGQTPPPLTRANRRAA
jgi:hypothetical protein